jgi:predicted transcriptional regulator of viral defense system
MRQKLTTSYILRRLRELGVRAFEGAEFSRVLGLDRDRAYRALGRLVASGYLERVGRGSYVVVDVAEGALAEPFSLGTRIVTPSYVSFWSALHVHGWTEQMPRQALFATTRRSRRTRTGAFSLRYVRTGSGFRAYPIAEPEKAILDSMYLPRYAGGMEEVRKALGEAIPRLSPALLTEYAARMGSRSLCSRMGFLLEGHGIDAGALQASASRVFVVLDPEGPRRGRFDARWHVIDNQSGGR